MRRPPEVFQVTCAANVAKSAALEVATHFDPGIVRRVEIRWPRGHSALTGIQIACAHQQLVPFTAGAFILGDSNARTYEIENPPQSGQWSAFVYNTDRRAHYWQLTYEVEIIRRPVAPPWTPGVPVSVDAIQAAALEL